MGDTVIKDADKLSPYEVGGLTTFLGSKGLDNHVKIKGKSVGKRMDHRKYYELAKKNESSNIQKTSELVNNNEKIMNKQVKEAFVKLATIKLAINYILRNRLMSKQAAMPRGSGLPTAHQAPSMGYTGISAGNKVPLQRNVSPVINSQSQEPNLFAEAKKYQNIPSSPSVPAEDLQPLRNYVPRSFKELRQVVGPAVRQSNGEKAWNSKTNTYDFGDGGWEAYQRERDRIERGFAQLTPEEQAKYENSYKRHIAALNRWRDFQNTQNPATPTKGQLAREQYNGQQLLQEADNNYYNSVNPTVVANNSLDLQGYSDDVNQPPLFANGSNLTLEDVLNGKSPENVPNNNQRHSILEMGSSPVAMTNYEPYPGYNKAPY